MCGIVGIIASNVTSDDIEVMSDVIIHRGPDDGGFWVDPSHTVALGHRRLSIIDLSPEGSQPMHSVSGRYVIVFNGEIYNFQELRRQVVESGFSHTWRGHSDTEVVLACIDTWGVEATLKKLNGMFAIALYDLETRHLHLARDRMGEKPLYYGKIGHSIYFGSEIKSIKQSCPNHLTLNRDALGLYMRHGYIPAPWSVYETIYKLQPGYWMTISVDDYDKTVVSPALSRPYWSISEVAATGIQSRITGSDTEIMNDLTERLMTSVNLRMISDVPLGAFLSGGYDSSLIVALMQAQSSKPIKTFSIGFDQEGYNEAVHAKAVASHLGTDHTELYVTPQQALDVIPTLSKMYCEPFADSSQIPTYLVAKLAKQHVTVALSGDAGDELFGGYTRYFLSHDLWDILSKLPLYLRHKLSEFIYKFPCSSWDKVLKLLFSILPSRYHFQTPGEKLYKLATVLESSSINQLYYYLVSGIKDPSLWLTHPHEAVSMLTDQSVVCPSKYHIERMMYLDMVSYLPDDILVKVDRASMAVSLETRVPFLDHELVEYSWRLPYHYKVRQGQGKWILKQLTHQYIPQEIMDRPKMGFGIPVGSWLRGPLRDWADALLEPTKLKNQGIFNGNYVRKQWDDHVAGRFDWGASLWTALMLQDWLDTELTDA